MKSIVHMYIGISYYVIPMYTNNSHTFHGHMHHEKHKYSWTSIQ